MLPANNPARKSFKEILFSASGPVDSAKDFQPKEKWRADLRQDCCWQQCIYLWYRTATQLQFCVQSPPSREFPNYLPCRRVREFVASLVKRKVRPARFVSSWTSAWPWWCFFQRITIWWMASSDTEYSGRRIYPICRTPKWKSLSQWRESYLLLSLNCVISAASQQWEYWTGSIQPVSFSCKRVLSVEVSDCMVLQKNF